MPRCITDQRLEGWLAQPLEGSQMPGLERLAATPHHFTDERLEGWLAQAPRRIADARPGALSRHPAQPY
jgi:hypothetical protein